ncbi:MAG: hypothetical protein QOE03_3458 [Micromonosporaceae bacterium]|nr:hypothetical protein [Micromonosporaceae bacterium]
MQPTTRRVSGALRRVCSFLTLVIVLNVLGLVVAAFNWLGHGRTPVTFRVFNSDVYGPRPPAVQPAFRGFDVQEVLVVVRRPSPPQQILEEIGSGTVWLVITLVLAVLARRTVIAAMQSDPFTPAMASRLTRLGTAVLIGGFAAEVMRLAASVALYRSAHGSGYALYAQNSRVGFWWLPLGLAVLAFAAVVRHGCALRAELDQVI